MPSGHRPSALGHVPMKGNIVAKLLWWVVAKLSDRGTLGGEPVLNSPRCSTWWHPFKRVRWSLYRQALKLYHKSVGGPFL